MATNRSNGQTEPDAARLHRFLRYSHVFSSAVREIMETPDSTAWRPFF